MTYTINIKAMTSSLTDEQFAQLCAKNPDLKFEINSKRELIVMSPTGSETGRRNSDLIGDFII